MTDWATRDDLAAVLKAFETDNRIFGDNYWALQAHADKFGWQPIPAPTSIPQYAKMGESGHWWSLFYGGMTTLVNSQEDMQTRAEQLRSHAYAMAGSTPPPHAVPAVTLITSKGLGLVGWHGVAGAVVYSLQRRASGSAPWETVCDKCATDADAPWVDAHPSSLFTTRYRVIAYNADGREASLRQNDKQTREHLQLLANAIPD